MHVPTRGSQKTRTGANVVKNGALKKVGAVGVEAGMNEEGTEVGAVEVETGGWQVVHSRVELTCEARPRGSSGKAINERVVCVMHEYVHVHV